MSDADDRMARLSPEQRRLLDLRLQRAREREGRARSGALPAADVSANETDLTGVDLRFGIIYFSGDGETTGADKYELLERSATFADRHGFSFLSVPEKHFQTFGGLYPNPAVTAAALAMVTEEVQLRAGSVVLPLHHPIRVAEEWAMVDNLSRGRVGIAFATGWHDRDFVIRPENFEARREVTFRDVRTVQRLWAGEQVVFTGVAGSEVPVRTLPRPLQPRLPTWITVSGSPETWRIAGELGANVLSSLMGQTLEEVEGKIRSYRSSYAAGDDGERGKVTIMLHTLLSERFEDAVATARAPLMDYVKSFMTQYDTYSAENPSGLQAESVSEADRDALAEVSFRRYVESGALIGTTRTCAPLLHRLHSIGVDEIACLVDFGADLDTTLESLRLVAQLIEECKPRASTEGGD